MRSIVLFLGLPLLLVSLACGGVLDEAFNEVGANKAAEFRSELNKVPDSPERQRALAAIDAFESGPNRPTIMGIANLEVAVQSAVADGELTAEEVDRIEAIVAGR